MDRLRRTILGAVFCGLSGYPLGILWALSPLVLNPGSGTSGLKTALFLLPAFVAAFTLAAGFTMGPFVYLLLVKAGVANLWLMALAGALGGAAIFSVFPGNSVALVSSAGAQFVVSGAVGGAAYWYGAERFITTRGGAGRGGATTAT